MNGSEQLAVEKIQQSIRNICGGHRPIVVFSEIRLLQRVFLAAMEKVVSNASHRNDQGFGVVMGQVDGL